MFCGGSFRCKLGDRNDQYRLVRRDSVQIRVLRSASLNHADGFGRRVFAVPDKVPENAATARICLEKNPEKVSLHKFLDRQFYKTFFLCFPLPLLLLFVSVLQSISLYFFSFFVFPNFSFFTYRFFSSGFFVLAILLSKLITIVLVVVL